ncbi:fucolectin-4-like [Eleutherodactylus coqui]|uniref:fucolectin-4-like n=1 Tax=Eleutherodactylus coqui TaxID=57060 RepID=UPI003462F99F
MALLTSLLLLGFLALTQAQTPGCSLQSGVNDLALNGVASQISDLQLPTMGYAKNAIDDVKDTTYKDGSCTHTTKTPNPWWQVDLQQVYSISKVIITNRLDCCSDRLLGAQVRIGNSPDNNNPVCGTVTSLASATLPFCCNGMVGQYISVVIPGRSEYLTLCEVEVYGDRVKGCH